MDDAALGLKLVTALRAISNSRDARGAPVRGKLTSLALNIGPEGWQAISQFWLTNDWNVSVGKDPVACLVEVLTTPPDLSESYEPRKRLSGAQPNLPVSEILVAGKAPDRPPEPSKDDTDLDDLLV
ncbi:MAG: hypothetical protein EOS07_21950 [Mesorhizobium sp.]|uniref:hypothetical protein n=1 Tax=Mesorhizobium sp. TaxID=1871066 RepID=UPI000FE7AE64|nr:hypothetical protein [Mesorhizobium sp.]RWO06306.1 MAG: hypothetical protein EOS07_21950 [Mesorhizobium sp.]RWP69552.1 MAG: hypothetical protein EOR07_03235 [Mesorhizobium sp.]